MSRNTLVECAGAVENTTKLCRRSVSTPTKSDPRPRAHNGPRPSSIWPVRRSLQCPPIISPPSQDFSAVVEMRRSTRDMQSAPLREIVNLIAFVTSPRFILEGDLLTRSRRLSPSAGALHPVDVVVVDWRGAYRMMHYNGWERQLEILTIQNTLPLQDLAKKCCEILPEASGTALVFLGSLTTVDAAYERPMSLLWRDAGALMQTFALAATAYRLAFCPLGILGGEVIEATGLNGHDIRPAGIAMIGRS
jgi:hypothetical protein